ncbi:hypothetical protein ACLOJK_027313 [Asimina triloba]
MKTGVDRSLGALKRELVIEEGVREREGCTMLGSARRQGKSIFGYSTLWKRKDLGEVSGKVPGESSSERRRQLQYPAFDIPPRLNAPHSFCTIKRSRMEYYLYSVNKKHIFVDMIIINVFFSVPYYFMTHGTKHHSHQEYLERADKARIKDSRFELKTREG